MSKQKLNVELLKRLKTRFLRMRHPEHSDMHSWGHKTDCGTTACIAGHVLLLQGYRLRHGQYVTPDGKPILAIAGTARDELGLSDMTASHLFYDFETTTPKQAAARLQELIDSAEANQ
jgi:hypothetical protein